MNHVTMAEFARIKGVSIEAVRKAVKTGRLVNSLKITPGKKVPKIDPVVAAAEWERNTDHSKRTNGGDIRIEPRQTPYTKPDVIRHNEPIANGGPSITQSKAILEAYKARLARIEYELKIEKLVEASDVKEQAFRLGRQLRDSMLNIPDRVSAEFAGIAIASEIHTRLTDEIRKVLEALGDDSAA